MLRKTILFVTSLGALSSAPLPIRAVPIDMLASYFTDAVIDDCMQGAVLGGIVGVLQCHLVASALPVTLGAILAHQGVIMGAQMLTKKTAVFLISKMALKALAVGSFNQKTQQFDHIGFSWDPTEMIMHYAQPYLDKIQLPNLFKRQPNLPPADLPTIELPQVELPEVQVATNAISDAIESGIVSA